MMFINTWQSIPNCAFGSSCNNKYLTNEGQGHKGVSRIIFSLDETHIKSALYLPLQYNTLVTQENYITVSNKQKDNADS